MASRVKGEDRENRNRAIKRAREDSGEIKR